MGELICTLCGNSLDDENYISAENGSPAHRECVEKEENRKNEEKEI